jgi:predicted transcriptional regulator
LTTKTITINRKWLLLPTEEQLLDSVGQESGFIEHISRFLDIRGEYFGFIMKSLLKRGLIRKRWTGRYKLTEQGRKYLLEKTNSPGIILN